jgi:hypothetical protein
MASPRPEHVERGRLAAYLAVGTPIVTFDSIDATASRGRYPGDLERVPSL